jgi:hypothetical protein
MDCPYCLEEIKDGAVVCRSCGRDLAFLVPILKRIIKAETDLLELTRLVHNLRSGMQDVDSFPSTTGSAAAGPLPWSIVCLLVLLPLMVISLVADGSYPGGHTWIITAFLVVLPALPSVWIGFRNTPTRGRLLFFGMAVCILSVGLMTAVDVLLRPDPWRTTLYWDLRNVPHLLKTFGIPSALLFVSGGWFGKWIKNARTSVKYGKSSLSRRLAGSLLKADPGESDLAFDIRVHRLSSVIAALTPVFSLAGSIVVAYFGYLGAIVKTLPK